MSGYKNRKEKKKPTQGTGFRRLLKNPWIFAGSALILDTAMLAVALVLSAIRPEAEYTLTETAIERSQPFLFFGVIAAAVLGAVCILTAFIIAGAFLKKRHAVQIAGAVSLLVISLIMLGTSAVTALGFPVKSRSYVNYSDEELRLIIEEEQSYFGPGKLSLFMTDAGVSDKVKLLSSTDILEYSTEGEERYTVSWISENVLLVGFEDGDNYRTLQFSVDRTEYHNSDG